MLNVRALNKLLTENVDHKVFVRWFQGGPNEAPKRVIRPNALETLTVEFDNRNLIVKYLQPKLLLVLEGGVPPGRKRELKVTAEAPDDARYPSEDSNGADRADTMLGTSVGSKASTTMPDDPSNKFF
ncbi:unnamed protein product [Aureobasidium pullulans]|nr:unnamed protein product [Aureobasidium pullulans]